MASEVRSYQTEHFAFWWNPSSPVDSITGDAGKIALGDSVPMLVRVAAVSMEKGWRTYLDSLGYLAPRANPTTYCFEQPVPAGKYPVEFCDVGLAMGQGEGYFGGTFPGNGGQSCISLASNLTQFDSLSGGLDLVRDLDGVRLKTVYSLNWDYVMAATCIHELFHAVQFNYEVELDRHGFFEASAVAMESRLVPSSNDYMQFGAKLAQIDKVVPFPTGINEYAYPQGWLVRSMMDDLGMEVVKALWESRLATASENPSFLGTMRQVLPNLHGSFETELGRNSMRVALTGKRSVWMPSGIAPFSDAGQFPELTGVLPSADSIQSLPLDLGAFQIHLDTIAPAEDRLFVWVPDEGVTMGWARTTPSGAKVTWESGSVRYSPADATRSAWVFANPGNPPALRAMAASEASTSHYRTIAAPARTSISSGQKLTWISPDGLVLAGTAGKASRSTPLLHLDVWKPSAAKDPFAAGVAGKTSGHAIVLEDADHVLGLSGATLRWEGRKMVSAYRGNGDGNWDSIAVSGNLIALGELDLSQPVRIIVSNTGSTKPVSNVPRPNPSRQSEPIRFPILGATGSETLTILAADGGIVRQLHPDPNETELVWDLRNRENRKLRPGVYTYIWQGVEGTNHGRLLVAE